MTDLLVSQKGTVLYLTLNRPERLNAFSEEMLRGLTQELRRAASDASVRVVVLSGAGRAFSAGGDVKTMQGVSPDEVHDHIEILIETVLTMVELQKPIVAAVHGVAAGAGFNLALASDLVVASDEARFMMSFVQVGLVSDGGGLWFLPRIVGPHLARELLYLGEPISAQRAYEMGIVNRVVPPEELERSVGELADKLQAKPRRVLENTKRLVGQSLSTGLSDMMHLEQVTQTALAATDDHHEGVRAFQEKREPQFRD